MLTMPAPRRTARTADGVDFDSTSERHARAGGAWSCGRGGRGKGHRRGAMCQVGRRGGVVMFCFEWAA